MGDGWRDKIIYTPIGYVTVEKNSRPNRIHQDLPKYMFESSIYFLDKKYRPAKPLQ